MNGNDFVKALASTVRDSAVHGTIKNLEYPPGRKPSIELITLSDWYKQLSGNDKEMLRKVLVSVADSSIFGVLAIIDGVRVVEDSSDKGEFELYYVKNDNKTLLNDPNEDYLHEMYKYIE